MRATAGVVLVLVALGSCVLRGARAQEVTAVDGIWPATNAPWPNDPIDRARAAQHEADRRAGGKHDGSTVDGIWPATNAPWPNDPIDRARAAQHEAARVRRGYGATQQYYRGLEWYREYMLSNGLPYPTDGFVVVRPEWGYRFPGSSLQGWPYSQLPIDHYSGYRYPLRYEPGGWPYYGPGWSR
ncbi:MAG TPA: hypothetical protein PLQ54_06575 [Armatimonadota bacterium]|mgnify:CR=1 FL=1|nr:hypothetical protein [Armatimonadota bacterium]